MAVWNTGSPTQLSTQGIATDASTTTLVAQITGLTNSNYELNVSLGASTVASFWIEHCLSTGVGSTALRGSSNVGHLGRKVVYTQTNASAQYRFRFKPEASDLIRVRLGSTFTGDAFATLQLEKLS